MQGTCCFGNMSKHRDEKVEFVSGVGAKGI